jgi:uncharacterized protein YkwD
MFALNLNTKSNLLSFTLFLLIGCGEISSSNPTQFPNQDDVTTTINTTQQEFLDAINKARSVARDCYPDDPNRGFMNATHALTWNNNLYASALEHSTDLATSNTFDHQGSGTESDITGDGEPSTFYERIESNGYSNYYTVGENIAGGQQTLEEAMNEWLKSPAHCTNIMKDTYKEVGVAVVVNNESTYGVYWTQNFGSKTK